MIPEIGEEGQEKIRNANVLVIGAGGLGCPALQYLSAAGVGKISIADFDLVDETNLARQVLYGSNDLGKLKSVIAKNRLEHINPHCEFTVINRKIDETWPAAFFPGYDVIVDATDNPETRYIINDGCVFHQKPMVHGSIYKHEGLISVFNYKGGPSYRDLNPEFISGRYLNPGSDGVGIFGVTPGITGLFMANEVIKILTGKGEVLSGKVLLINTFTNSFRVFNLSQAAGTEKLLENMTN